MSNSTSEGKIYSAISAIMKDMEAVPKDKKSEGGGGNYRYRSIDQIYAALQKHMAKHGVFTVPERLNRVDSTGTTKSGGVMHHAVITFRYTFYASDGSSIQVVLDGEGMDSSDKVSGKCASYAHKYALLQVFCIPTEDADDPDKNTHEPIMKTEPVKTKEPEIKNHAPQPDKNKTVGALRRLMEVVGEHKIPNEEVSAVIREVTGKEHTKELTVPELEFVVQNLLDSRGAPR